MAQLRIPVKACKVARYSFSNSISWPKGWQLVVQAMYEVVKNLAELALAALLMGFLPGRLAKRHVRINKVSMCSVEWRWCGVSTESWLTVNIRVETVDTYKVHLRAPSRPCDGRSTPSTCISQDVPSGVAGHVASPLSSPQGARHWLARAS